MIIKHLDLRQFAKDFKNPHYSLDSAPFLMFPSADSADLLLTTVFVAVCVIAS